MKSIKIYIYLWIFWYFSQNFFDTETHNSQLMEKTEIQVERTWDLVRDSGQRKLTSSFQNHCTLHSVPVGAKPLSPRQCAPSRSIYLSRRLNSHWEILVTTHHLQKWESQLRLRWIKTVEYQRLKINLRINQTVKSEITKRFSIRMIRIDCSIIPQNDECQLLFYGIFFTCTNCTMAVF